MKKYLAEMIGTMILVFIGCGTAVSLNCGVDTASIVGTALAFGITFTTMEYTIGGISGCHINPAITLGYLISRRIKGKDAVMYMLFQIIGAFIGSAILYALTSTDMSLAEGTMTDANSCGDHGIIVCLIIETVLTAIFVLVVLGTTDPKKGAGNFAGLAIGLSLITINLVGIHYTGASVNPARSIAPAIFEGGQALSDLWIFIIAPFLGAVIAAAIWKTISEKNK